MIQVITNILTLCHFVYASAKELNENLNKIKNWTFQWKMDFKPHPSKQAQQVLFSSKTRKVSHSSLFFHNAEVSQTSFQNNFMIIWT